MTDDLRRIHQPRSDLLCFERVLIVHSDPPGCHSVRSHMTDARNRVVPKRIAIANLVNNLCAQSIVRSGKDQKYRPANAEGYSDCCAV